MNTIDDLHLATEILPIFDYTRNSFASAALLDILLKPLPSIAAIRLRQEIIKGFMENLRVLQDYSYARPEFHEVHSFLIDTAIQEAGRTRLTFKLLASTKDRHALQSKLVQFVLLFHRLHTTYLGRMRTECFPDDYRAEIPWMLEFLAIFRLNVYEKLIREDNFTVAGMTELATIIAGEQLSGAIELFYKKLSAFEAYLSIAKAMAERSFCIPTLVEGPLIFEQLYHPALKAPVSNSFSSRSNVLLLTGPNMSGKSTFLKSVALCVYLAHVGVGVPAAAAQLPFFDHISVSINHNDDIVSGYSHFMAEIMRLKAVLIAANENKKCFAVFDELFKGTNIEDAVQISSSTVAGLPGFSDSYFFISTHLHQLQELEEVQSKKVDCYYLDCNVKNDTPAFTYELKEGWSSLRVGQILFEQEGLNELLRRRKALNSFTANVPKS